MDHHSHVNFTQVSYKNQHTNDYMIGPPTINQTVNSSQTAVSAVIGEFISISCNSVLTEQVTLPYTLTNTWYKANDSKWTEQNNVLTFDPMMYEDKGRYQCISLLTVLGTDVNDSVSKTIDVIAKGMF